MYPWCSSRTHCSGWTLKPYRYIIKIYYNRQHQKEFCINTCYKNRKKCAWEIKSGVIKCIVRARLKRVIKKENKRIRNDRSNLLPEVRAFYKRYFSLLVLWNRSKWYVFEPSAITVTGDHREDIPRKRD